MTDLLAVIRPDAFVLGSPRFAGPWALPWDVVIPPYVVVVIFLMLATAFLAFYDHWVSMREQNPTPHPPLRRLLPDGTITSKRAIYLEIEETRCPTYLIECEDMRLLCLYGQYLHKLVQGRRRCFPSTVFHMRRFVGKPSMFIVRPKGNVYMPDVICTSMRQLSTIGLVLRDGEYLPMWTLERVKRALAYSSPDD
ncbi:MULTISPECIES: hypothetical protein [Dyella]|uniref:Uncharacterized protein n=2 Tax=Dyella TaxID=231454 RepID=A0A4R0YDH5_9GAMM|nr:MULTISPECIES: hypothetical protein [Dyella]TBR36066.1 hypothetical protein EYV96_15780 [Dyella terrae]TCI06116.1 hypothetical protein EZM97_34875 [Dyella soli]